MTIGTDLIVGFIGPTLTNVYEAFYIASCPGYQEKKNITNILTCKRSILHRSCSLCWLGMYYRSSRSCRHRSGQ